MKVSRGKIHKYLGMQLDFSVKGRVKVTMIPYMKEIVVAFEKLAPNEKGTKSSAAPRDLFTVNDNCEKLSERYAVKFHSLVCKTLFATKRAWPETGTSLSFLTTRTREPDQQDWGKLVWLMTYIRGTLYLPLILSANGSGMLK